VSLARYKLWTSHAEDFGFDESPDGEWVKYDDLCLLLAITLELADRDPLDTAGLCDFCGHHGHYEHAVNCIWFLAQRFKEKE
jgi:hypothetical protein